MFKLLSIALAVVLSASSALACSAPPDETYVQGPELAAVTSSYEVLEQLRAEGGKDVESVRATKESYVISSSNGAYVAVRVNYARAEGGMCPSITGVEIVGSGRIK